MFLGEFNVICSMAQMSMSFILDLERLEKQPRY